MCNNNPVSNCYLFDPPEGIDGPAAFLGSEVPDTGSRVQILSVSQTPSSQSPPAEETERDGDTDTLLEPKTDIHELLQRRGGSFGDRSGTMCPVSSKSTFPSWFTKHF